MGLEIEAHIGCCNDCPKRVEKYLRCLKGVQSVDVYPEISKVVVMGDVDPDIILREVKRVRENARILTKDSSANNLSATPPDEYGYKSHQNISKKKMDPAVAAVSVKDEAYQKAVPMYLIKPADEVMSMKEEAYEKDVAAYTPPKSSYGRDRVASEQEKYSVSFSYGLFGGGVSYSRSKTYKNNGE